MRILFLLLLLNFSFVQALRLPANENLSIEEEISKWMLPNYSNQESALGYSENAFKVPPSLPFY